MQVFTGLPISQGLAAGKIIFLGTQETVVRQAGSPQEEQARFAAAQQQAIDALGALYEKAKAELGERLYNLINAACLYLHKQIQHP